MITGEIKRFLRDDGMLKVSRSLKEIAYKAYQAKEALTEKLGREPLLEEIAEETGVEKEELVMAMEAAGEVESLHRPVGMKDGNEVMLLEKIADTGGAEEKILDHLLPDLNLRIILFKIPDHLRKPVRRNTGICCNRHTAYKKSLYFCCELIDSIFFFKKFSDCRQKNFPIRC